MAGNRSQIYIDTIDNSSQVFKNIATQIQMLQGTLSSVGNTSTTSFNKMNSSLSQQTGLLNSINSSFKDLGGTILKTAGQMVAITGAILVVKRAGEELINLFKDGVQVNIDTETTRIGIAGLIASLYQINQDGIELQGMDKLNASLTLSEDIIKRLRIEAIKTGASFEELQQGFLQSVGGGSVLGINVDELVKISSLITNAAKGFGLGKGQTAQETRALFSGEITRDSTIGTALGFGPGGAFEKEYKEAFKKGGNAFTEFITERLEQFKNAGEIYANTLGGVFDQLSETTTLFKGEIAKGLNEELLNIKETVNSLFDDSGFTSSLDGLTATLQAIGSFIGENIVNAFETVVDVVFQISSFLEKDQIVLNSIIEIVIQIKEVFESIVGVLGTVFGLIGDVFISFLNVFGLTTDTNKELTGMQATLKFITGVVGGLNIAFGLVQDTVRFLASSIRVLLGGAIDFVMSNFREFINAVGRTAGRLGLENVAKDLNDFAVKINSSKEKAMESVIGADNLLLNAPGVNTSTYEKLRFFFKDTMEAADSASVSLENSTKSQNKTVQSFLDRLKEARKELSAAGSSGIGTNPPDTSGRNQDKNKNSRGNDITNELLKGYQKELDAFKKGNDIKRKENELLYQNFRKNIIQFYDTKQSLDEADFRKSIENYNKEIAIIEQVRGTRKTKKENEALEVKLLELINKRENAEKEYNLRVQETFFAREKDLRKVQETIKNFNAGIQDLLGNKVLSTRIKIDLEVDNLIFENQNNPEMLKLIPIYEQIKKFKAEQEQQNSLLSLSEDRLNILREEGFIVQVDYLQQLGSLNKERLKQYEDELNLIRSLAPDQQDNLRIKELENLILKTRANLDPLAKDIKKTFDQSFGTFFNDVISGTKSVKDAFRDLVNSVQQYLSKLVSEKLVQQLFGGSSGGGLFDGLFGSLGGGSSGGNGGGLGNMFGGFISSLFGMATGGFMEAGKPYKVGETGTELFIPKTSGYMMNSSRTNDLMMGSRNNGGITNINVSLATPNYTSFNNSEGQLGAMFNTSLRKAQRNL